jgi:vacuolar-type H+-ATPase subunit E/Vma4
MSVERITKRIIDDVENQVKKIRDDYEHKINELKQKSNEAIERIRIETENKIKYESQSILERATTLANLDKKKKILAKKWEIINDVFDSVAKKFLTHSDYSKLVTQLIEIHTDKENSEVILSKSDINRMKGNLPNVKFTESKFLKGGVIIRSEKIEKNFSLDATLNILKDELIIDLAKILFETS